ncbi:HlyD family type I secretion periplasmic adaptor subunit [Mesorhizobium plurifarium]|uniref:HlyD family type I secretion periplasmic adaptor subunit n=1 Tax=Sinorhizobium arboris TaxID=76745 RepID=UPI00040B4022|nr:HlyD family type I secretion periplasmic adaptor subunit [Sinorhizobium arboris]PST25569.1 HlyD family type I secretion periplasmic adaptor subunit [Mesorhizobium plurifarium]
MTLPSLLWKRSGGKQRRQRADAEFLPAALEILETPPSPVRASLIWLLCTLATGALLWSWIGTFDIVATSQGKIQPLGRVKIVQTLEAGKVRSVPVVNGQEVKAGDLLVDLDDTELRAESEMLSIGLAALKAEILRRDRALALAAELGDGSEAVPSRKLATEIAFPAEIPVPIRRREQAVLDADVSELVSVFDRIRAQKKQKQAEMARLSSTIKAQRTLVSTLGERVAMRTSLLHSQSGSKADVINAAEVSQRAEAELTVMVGQAAEAETGLQVLAAEQASAIRGFVAENARQRADVARRADEQEQLLRKATARLHSMKIRSLITGTVQASAITTVGQIVTSGTELMRVVPVGGPIEIEAYLPNRDIGFVAAGMPAVIKIEAFPFTRYGIVEGKVVHVATDAIPEPDAQQIEGAAAKEIESLVPIGNAQRMQNLVFSVTVRPSRTTITVDGRVMPLKPGMAVTVEIKTGKRRILEYLFSPIAEVASQAMGER